MSLAYANLDSETRRFMLEEIKMDIANGSIYLSNYLNDRGAAAWPDLLIAAATSGTDNTLGSEIRSNDYLKTDVQRRKPTGGSTTAKVPFTAHETLGEGEFGRYYVRGLCRRAINEGVPELIVYRAKEVTQPRPGSEEKIGKRVIPQDILQDLRAMPGVEPLLGLPSGPNSGLTLRLP